MKIQVTIGRFVAALAACACVSTGAASAQQLAMEPLKESGSNVYPAYEGWYKNDDGTYTLLVGYYNRNTKEELDVPLGPNNRFDTQPDMGQPTHFLTRRRYGFFVVTVPKEFSIRSSSSVRSSYHSVAASKM